MGRSTQKTQLTAEQKQLQRLIVQYRRQLYVPPACPHGAYHVYQISMGQKHKEDIGREGYWCTAKSPKEAIELFKRNKKAGREAHPVFDSTVYKFHGETAEQYWAELNQLGPQIRQMNHGRRHDTIINSHNHWNSKKVENMSRSLKNQILDAELLHLQHRQHFEGLSDYFTKKGRDVAAWRKEDRTLRQMKNGEVQCVYRHRQDKVVSQKKVFNMLISSFAKSNHEEIQHDGKSSPVVMVNDAIKIQDQQLKLRDLREQHKHLSTPESEASIADHTKKLRADAIAAQAASDIDIVDEKLFLPSDLSASQRSRYEMTELTQIELKLREGALFDHVQAVQEIAKVLSIDLQVKRVARGVKANTRSMNILQGVQRSRDAAIKNYNRNRNALIALGTPTEKFPPMTEADTRRKPTNTKRQVGDSRRGDGITWALTGASRGAPDIVVGKVSLGRLCHAAGLNAVA
ncbi:hypothetical protein MD484_g6884, partial [Candolleomyces efflorescens]